MTDKIVTVKVRVPANNDLDAALRVSTMIVKSGCRSCRVVGIDDVEPAIPGVENRGIQRPKFPGQFLLGRGVK